MCKLSIAVNEMRSLYLYFLTLIIRYKQITHQKQKKPTCVGFFYLFSVTLF